VAWHHGGTEQRREAGFTLTELILVVAILATIAGIGAPRFFGVSEFDERFFFDEARAAVAYAQKLAVGSGCDVRVTLDASGYELLQRQSCTSGVFDQDVANPGSGAATYTGSPPPGLSLASTVSPVRFDALGRARNGGGAIVNFTVTVGTRTFDTIGETGFVDASGP
jgi:MSHA pilin protein MshC